MARAGDVLARRYRLCERAGSGGMGDVWQSRDLLLRRTVAVKVLRPGLYDQSTFLERFRREAQAIAALSNSGIVDIFDYGELDGLDEPIAYLVMPLVSGMPLSRRIAGWGNLSVAETMHIVAQVADSLQSAHEAGIIHRDVKPGNILLKPDGTTVLVDFGVARARVNPTLTATGIVVGTLTYMSPEQASGDHLTPATDIYSLGAVAHECLTGKPPYSADTPLQVLSAHLQSTFPQLPDEVPETVKQTIGRALQQYPQQRWESASAFASACRDAVTAETVIQDAVSAPAAPTDAGPIAPASAPQLRPEPDSAARSRSAMARRGWGVRSLVVVSITAVLLVAAGWAASAWSTLELTPVRGGFSQTVEPNQPQQPETASFPPADTSPPASEATPTRHQQSSSSSSSTPSTSGTPEENTSPPVVVPTPDVVSLSESNASARIEESQLVPNVSYHGEGDIVCSVIAQQPAAGHEVERGSTVAITVARASEKCP